MKAAIKIVLFSVIGMALFFTLQELFVPESSTGRSNADEVIQGFREADRDSYDAVFLGASHMGCGISPLALYEETGICSYNIATDGQPVEASYHLLKEFLKTQSPQLVVFDVSGMFMEDNAERSLRWRHILDNYELGLAKLEMAKTYSELTYSEGFLAAIFPMIKYHTRWNELLQSDFSSLFREPDRDWLLGGRMEPLVVKNTYSTVTLINAVSKAQQADTQMSCIEDGELTMKKIVDPLFVPTISERDLDYFIKIKELCDKNHAQLVLIKVPVLQFTQIYPSAWTRQKSGMIQGIAEKYDVPFFDILYDANAGINWQTDSCDGGYHLNIRGELKVTKAMAKYLTDHFALKPRGSEKFDRSVEAYHKALEIAGLESETDFYTYLKLLEENKDRWTVLVAAREEYTLGMDETSFSLLEGMGLSLVRDAHFRDSYVAILERGKVRYEACSGRRIDHSMDSDGVTFTVGSAGWNVGSYSALAVDGVDYAQPVRGLGFLVYDNESGLVIDSVSFDPVLDGKPAVRDSVSILAMLSAYLDWVEPEAEGAA